MDIADPRRGAGNSFEQFKVAAKVRKAGEAVVAQIGGWRVAVGPCGDVGSESPQFRPVCEIDVDARAANEEVGNKRPLCVSTSTRSPKVRAPSQGAPVCRWKFEWQAHRSQVS